MSGPEPLGARTYDVLQVLLGSGRSRAKVEAMLRATSPARVIDLGAGTGFYAAAVPLDAEYAAVDTDAERLESLLRRRPGAHVARADATELPFADDSFDVALCVALAHHLSDDELARLIDEAARVATRLVLLDPLRSAFPASRLLWRFDRGSHPRSESELLAAVQRRFAVESKDTYRIVHRYLLCAGSRLA